MSNSDRERWDARWAESQNKYERAPHLLLVRFISQRGLNAGRALDVACGVGQDAIWLARHGFDVDAVDISPVALARAREIAVQAGVTVNFIEADLESWSPPQAAYDLVAGFRFLNRKLWPHLKASLRRGGWLVYQTFNVHKLQPDADFPREYLLEPGELPNVFAGWHIVEHGDDGGPSHNQSWIICQKP